jgi:hypothetical protein
MTPRIEQWFQRTRAWIIAYEHAEVSCREHQAILDKIAARLGAAIEDEDPFRRRVARCVGQYMAQRHMRPAKSLVFAELASCVLLPGLLCWWLLQGIGLSNSGAARVSGRRWLISRLRYDMTPEVYHTPPELGNASLPIAYTPRRYLRFSDLQFLVRAYGYGSRLLSAPHLQWCFKITKEIAWARAVIEQFPSDYAVIADECNCALSLLTEYANQHGTQMYVVQHGDLFFSVFTAFFETNRSYCWADFYVEMLKRLQARSEFRIYTNPSFVMSEEDRALVKEARGIGVFHPSFFTLTTPEERDRFAASIRALSERYSVEVRPHPAYFHEYEAMAASYGPKVVLSPPAQKSAKQFALQHQVIIGTTSAAILEALMLGREVISVDGFLVGEVAEYHFAYRMPNCTLSKLDQLEQNAVRLIEAQGIQAASE